MNVKELKPQSAVPEIVLEVTSISEPKNFASSRGSGRLCNFAGKDSEGKEVRVTLWNEQCGLPIKEGSKVKIENGWCTEYNGEKQVSAGKFGTINIVPE
ncbi:MAG: SOSS complex subunit B family protein [Candidatus Diapherotrites archaeon]|nr:SOSS complex subunit B family protein [Candidatus Diapherotrites archaeon]